VLAACLRKYVRDTKFTYRAVSSDTDQAGRKTTSRIRFLFPSFEPYFRKNDDENSKSGGLEAQMKVHPILEQRRGNSAVININRVQP
jgi:hypothetical protein